jgi:hypothetical protein
MLTRRTLLASAATIPIVGCSTTGTIQQQIQQVIDTIQAYAAQACGIIPTVKSILDIAAAFGVPLASVGAVALQTVEQAICASVPPKSSARFARIPLRTAGSAPGRIGNAPTPIGPVVVNGWRTQ